MFVDLSSGVLKWLSKGNVALGFMNNTGAAQARAGRGQTVKDEPHSAMKAVGYL